MPCSLIFLSDFDLKTFYLEKNIGSIQSGNLQEVLTGI